MPTYNFINTNTEEEFTEFFTSFEKAEEFLNSNPHLKKQLTTPSFIGGRTIDGGKLPGGFKDKLKLIKEKHPRGKGVDHLI